MQSCMDIEAKFQTNISPSPVVNPLRQYHLRAEHAFLQAFSLCCAFDNPLMRFSSTISYFFLTKHTFSPDWCEDSDSKFQVLFQYIAFLPFFFFTLERWNWYWACFKLQNWDLVAGHEISISLLHKYYYCNKCNSQTHYHTPFLFGHFETFYFYFENSNYWQLSTIVKIVQEKTRFVLMTAN